LCLPSPLLQDRAAPPSRPDRFLWGAFLWGAFLQDAIPRCATLLLLAGLFLSPHHAAAQTDTLIAAAQAGNIAQLRALLQRGADPDAADGARNTALIYAARDGRFAVARLLVDAGATVDWVDGEGVIPRSADNDP